MNYTDLFRNEPAMGAGVYDAAEAARFIAERSGESPDDAAALVTAVGEYLLILGIAQSADEGLMKTVEEERTRHADLLPSDAGYVDHDLLLEYVKRTTPLDPGRAADMIAEEVAYHVRLGTMEPEAYEDAKVWARRKSSPAGAAG